MLYRTNRGSSRETIVKLRLTAVRYAARDIHLLEFRTLGGALTPASAGSHVDVSLPNGLRRQYSLVLRDAPPGAYVIAVKLEQNSRGGSRYLLREARVGDVLEVSEPRNHFQLNPAARHSVLIAGGIGITPIISMVHELSRSGRPMQLHYAARSREDMAFLGLLRDQPFAHLHFDDESGGRPPDIRAIVERAPSDADFYCCGPGAMMAAFESAAARVPPSRKHVEYFSGAQPAGATNAFSVSLARSGRVVTVAPGQTILDALLQAGVDVPYSCSEGVCGACEAGVLSGTPDHRDLVLTPEAHAAGKTMMICCSGSLSSELVLDL